MNWQSFLLGLSQGVFCMGICLPVLGTYLLSRERKIREHFLIICLFLSGRFFGYMAFAFIVGVFSKAFSETRLFSTLFPFAYAVLGVMLVFYGLSRVFPKAGFCRAIARKSESRLAILTMGTLTGFHLCPPFMAVTVIALEEGGILESLLIFSSFFAATSLYVIPVFFLGSLSRFSTMRISASLAAMISGMIFVIRSAVFFSL